MKTKYVSDLVEDAVVTEAFFVVFKALKRSRNGAPYLALLLSDRGGQIEARVWDDAERLGGRFAQGDFLRVKAQASSYRDSLQLNVSDLERLDPAAVDLSDFLPSSERDPEEMLRELKALTRGMGNPHLAALLKLIWADRTLVAALTRSPAAKGMHHAYVGGLLEHTLSVARLAKTVAAHYPDVDADLLLTGAILHDIGKVRELSCSPGFDYTTEGRLVGHLLLGLSIIEEKIRGVPRFPVGLATALKHLMASHHGEYIFGSPKRPKTAEALMLHAIDDLDAKLATVRELLRSAAAGGGSAYHKLLERYVFATLAENETEAPP
ncbi:MAG: HD domain-containing protein [Pseudomonadota bacterium]